MSLFLVQSPNMTHKPSSDMLRLQQGNVTSDVCIDLIQVPETNVSIKKTLDHHNGKKQ